MNRKKGKLIHFTKTTIEALPFTEKGQTLYWDDLERGLCIRVGKQSKVYYAVGRLGKKERFSGSGSVSKTGRQHDELSVEKPSQEKKPELKFIKIDKHNRISVENARQEAKKILVDLNKGIDPNKHEEEAVPEPPQDITLAAAMKTYFDDKKEKLRPSTVATYEFLINRWLGDWKERSLKKIGTQNIEDRFKHITQKAGGVSANNVMRTFRIIYNYASIDYSLPTNPVKILDKKKQWNHVRSRRTVIGADDLNKWYGGVQSLKNPLLRDAFMVLLLTGCREQEILSLRWNEVNLQSKTLTITAERSKNHREHVLPLSDALYAILKRRSQLAENEYVFPGIGKTGHLVEIKFGVDKVTQVSGIKFCIHDLRRTFSTIADGVCTRAQIDELTNHKNDKDMTAGYIVYGIDHLRKPMQRITNRIFRAINDVKPGNTGEAT